MIDRITKLFSSHKSPLVGESKFDWGKSTEDVQVNDSIFAEKIERSQGFDTVVKPRLVKEEPKRKRNYRSSKSFGDFERTEAISDLDFYENEVIDLSSKIEELEDLVIIDFDREPPKDSIKKSIQQFFSDFFNSDASDEELKERRAQIIENSRSESIDLSDIDLRNIDLSGIVGSIVRILIDQRDRFIEKATRIKKCLPRVRYFLDLRLRIKRFIDNMYLYHSLDDEESNSYRTNIRFENSFIMNSLNPLHHAIKTRNGGVFRLTPNAKGMESRAA